MHSPRVNTSTRHLPRERRVLARRAPLALFLVFALASCATLAPGADPIVVRTEQALEAALAVYDAGMTWAEGHPHLLTPEAAKVAEGIRKGFPHVYRTVDSGLQLYKTGKGAPPDPAELNRLVLQLAELVRLAGGPDLTGGKK